VRLWRGAARKSLLLGFVGTVSNLRSV
jgi:hypothetical protein